MLTYMTLCIGRVEACPKKDVHHHGAVENDIRLNWLKCLKNIGPNRLVKCLEAVNSV